MKKFNQDKKDSKESFANVFNAKGFYIILALSIIIIGGATALIAKQNFSFQNLKSDTENFIPEDFENFLIDSKNDLVANESGDNELSDSELSDNGLIDNKTDEEESLQASNDIVTVGKEQTASTSQSDIKIAINESEAVKISDNKDKGKQDDIQDNKKNNKPETTEKESATEEKSTANASLAEKETAGEEQQVAEETQATADIDFIMPVYGSIIYDFSMEQLAYSKTLEDWRTHSGIDISAARGTAVKAVANGVVSQALEDPKLGFTVIVDHENGYKTVYSNLASGDLVVPNQIVAQGESIGSVGDTASYEIALEPHLHFEVMKDDKITDPKLYLPDY